MERDQDLEMKINCLNLAWGRNIIISRDDGKLYEVYQDQKRLITFDPTDKLSKPSDPMLKIIIKKYVESKYPKDERAARLEHYGIVENPVPVSTPPQKSTPSVAKGGKTLPVFRKYELNKK